MLKINHKIYYLLLIKYYFQLNQLNQDENYIIPLTQYFQFLILYHLLKY